MKRTFMQRYEGETWGAVVGRRRRGQEEVRREKREERWGRGCDGRREKGKGGMRGEERRGRGDGRGEERRGRGGS